jgi:hypothetical protein
MNTIGTLPDPHLVQMMAILDVLEAALVATTHCSAGQSVCPGGTAPSFEWLRDAHQ